MMPVWEAAFFFEAIPDWVRDVPGKVVLAGGLNSSNVGSVIEGLRPFGIDVSSSVEIAPRIKSREKMAEFIKAAKA
jgi:phosphoribosylanthranilate isomerase